MNSNKRYFKVIISIVLLSSLFFVFVGAKLILSKNPEYIVLDNNTAFEKKYNKWTQYKAFKSFNWELLNIYIDHKYKGKKYLYYNDKTYLFNKKKEALKYNGDLIAFSNSKYKDLEFKTSNSSDNTYKNILLKKNNIDPNQELTSNYYIDIDIDNDGNKEKIYVISNLFPIDDINTSTFFSFVFLVKDNNINVIYKNIKKTKNSYSGCKPYIKNIINIPNEKNNAIILDCAYYSVGKINTNMYLYKNNKFVKVKK